MTAGADGNIYVMKTDGFEPIKRIRSAFFITQFWELIILSVAIQMRSTNSSAILRGHASQHVLMTIQRESGMLKRYNLIQTNPSLGS